MSEDKKRKAVIYQRIGSHLQAQAMAETSFPIPQYIQDQVTQGNYQVLKIFIDEGVSANSIERPSLYKMIDFIKAHSEQEPIAVFFEMSHLTRDSETLFKLRDKIVEAGGSIADPNLVLHINMMATNIQIWNSLPWFTKLKFWIFGRLKLFASNG